VAEPDRYAAGLRWRQAPGSAQPLSRPPRGERPPGRIETVSPDDLLQARQQEVLDGVLDRAKRERRLDRAIGAVVVVGEQRADSEFASAARLERARMTAAEIESPPCKASRNATTSPCV
jgi:hypothetical protein